MTVDINFIFHKSCGPFHYQGLMHFHTLYFYDFIRDYVSPIDPDFKIDTKYKITVVKRFKDIKPLSKCMNVIFIPMNYPLITSIEHNEPTMLEDLYRLDDLPNVKLVMDYNNETLLPGNFDPTGKTGFVGEMDHSRFYCTTYGWDRYNVKDVLPFKKIIGNMIYTFYWLSKAIEEQPYITKPDLIYTYPGKQTPIRYFVPSNMFRPNRAQCIVQMHEKNMLFDSEWNMNKFNDFFNFREIQKEQNTFEPEPYVEEYLRLFGSTPRYNSWPWKSTYNKKRVLEDQGHLDYHAGMFDSYHSIDPDLLNNILIYIVQETFSDYKGEEPNDPSKPMYVMDITEKTWKGFLYGIPMFLNARPYSIERIENHGFDMLTDYYKFDYDKELDLTKRLNLMLESAQEFPTPNKDMVDRMKHNKNKLVSKEYLWNAQKEFLEIMLDKK